MITTEFAPHASLESLTDSEVRAERHALSAIESSFSSKRCAEQALEASSGWGIVKGEGATSQFKPLPLNKKEKEILKNDKISEAKAKDSEKLDSESENKTETARVEDSEKWNLESNAFTSLDSKTSSIALSQKEKGFIPSPLPLAPKRISAAFSFRQSRGVPRLSASSSSVAAALLPPCFNASAPRSGREQGSRLVSLPAPIDSIAVERDSTAGEFRIRVRF